MSANLFQISRTAMLAAAISAWSVGGVSTSAYAQCCEQHGSTYDGEHASHQHGTNHSAAKQSEAQPPHGGQVTKMEPLTFEVVYRPREIRVYIYGLIPYPESAKEARGEVVMQMRGNPQVFRHLLSYVAPPAGSSEQDYLAAALNLTHVRDGDVRVTFNLENLPLPHRPKVTFTQTFAISKTKVQLQVTVASLGEDDKAGIARQRVCPVTGAPLGSMGDPIKVLIDGRPLYLCCQGCVAKVKNAPEAYLAKVSQSHESR